jgi:hypothetical protein
MPEKKEDAWIRPVIKSLGREERKKWSEEELKHIIKGYAYSLKSLRPKDSPGQFDANLRYLLRITHRLTFGNLASVVFTNFLAPKISLREKVKYAAGTFFEQFRRRRFPLNGWYTRSTTSPLQSAILLRAAYPSFLGRMAAHESGHAILGKGQHDEEIPTKLEKEYERKNPWFEGFSKSEEEGMRARVSKAIAVYEKETSAIQARKERRQKK